MLNDALATFLTMPSLTHLYLTANLFEGTVNCSILAQVRNRYIFSIT